MVDDVILSSGRDNGDAAPSLAGELAVLGTMISDASVVGEVLAILDDSKVFIDVRHRAIFEVIQKLHQDRLPCTLTSLGERLGTSVCSAEYLQHLVDSVPNPRNAPGYAESVLEHYLRRQRMNPP